MRSAWTRAAYGVVMLAAVVVCFGATAAAAEPDVTSAPAVAAAGAMTTAMAVVLVLSALAGIASYVAQLAVTPKTWVVPLVMGGAFVGGIVGYEMGLPAPLFDAQHIMFAILAGISAVTSSSLPSFVMHGHYVLPAQARAVRLAKARTGAAGSGSIRAIVFLSVAGPAFVAACSLFQKTEPPIMDCAKRVLDDAAAGMTVAQIIADTTTPCALDIVQVVVILIQNGQSTGVAQTRRVRIAETPAYFEAMRLRDTLLDAGAPPPAVCPGTSK